MISLLNSTQFRSEWYQFSFTKSKQNDHFLNPSVRSALAQHQNQMKKLPQSSNQYFSYTEIQKSLIKNKTNSVQTGFYNVTKLIYCQYIGRFAYLKKYKEITKKGGKRQKSLWRGQLMHDKLFQIWIHDKTLNTRIKTSILHVIGSSYKKPATSIPLTKVRHGAHLLRLGTRQDSLSHYHSTSK